jgi:hypothetical protein
MLVLVSPSANSCATRTDEGTGAAADPADDPSLGRAPNPEGVALSANRQSVIAAHRRGPGRALLAEHGPFRYALYRSYALLGLAPIEPITEHIPDRLPLRKAQRSGGEAYESPALPLSYSATVVQFTERDPGRQPRSIERMTIGQHITVGAGGERQGHDGLTATPAQPRRCRSGGCLGRFLVFCPRPAGTSCRAVCT